MKPSTGCNELEAAVALRGKPVVSGGCRKSLTPIVKCQV